MPIWARAGCDDLVVTDAFPWCVFCRLLVFSILFLSSVGPAILC